MKREPFALKRRRRSSPGDVTKPIQTPYDDTSLAGDDWSGAPAEGPWFKWWLGVALPLFLAGYGVAVLISREGHLPNRGEPMALHGINAVAYGVAALSLGVFLHCHYFWGSLYDSAWQAELGKIVGLIGIVAGLGSLIVRVGMLGAH